MDAENPDLPPPASGDRNVIRSTADRAANRANMAAIDRLVATKKYAYIVGWGKWLGFTPETVREHVALAEEDNAPFDVVQKIDGAWVRLNDIANETNRKRVEELASTFTSKGRDSWTR